MLLILFKAPAFGIIDYNVHVSSESTTNYPINRSFKRNMYILVYHRNREPIKNIFYMIINRLLFTALYVSK